MIMFVALFSYMEWEDFFSHTQTQENIQRWSVDINQKLADFSVDDIRELENVELYYTPYKKLLDTLVSKINWADRYVYVEVYMLTETRIKEALTKAHKRWVDVKIVLEHSPYKAVSLNRKHFAQLQKSGIDIVWSNAENFSLNHSKIMLIDDEAILSTGNFTYSTFAYNRDFFVITDDESVVMSLKNIFLDDYEGTQSTQYNHQLVVSPHYSRAKFEVLIDSATQNIDVYAQYLKDPKTLERLYKRAGEWVSVRIVLSENWYEDYLEELQGKTLPKNIEIRPISAKAKMHSKAFLIDQKYLFIGSINLSTPSIDQNREFGILLANPEIITKFSEVFSGDFESE